MFQGGYAYGNAFAVLVNRNNPLRRNLLSLVRSRRQQSVYHADDLRRRQGGGVTYGALPTFLELSAPTAPRSRYSGVTLRQRPVRLLRRREWRLRPE